MRFPCSRLGGPADWIYLMRAAAVQSARRLLAGPAPLASAPPPPPPQRSFSATTHVHTHRWREGRQRHTVRSAPAPPPDAVSAPRAAPWGRGRRRRHGRHDAALSDRASQPAVRARAHAAEAIPRRQGGHRESRDGQCCALLPRARPGQRRQRGGCGGSGRSQLW